MDKKYIEDNQKKNVKNLVIAAASISGGGAERVAVILANYFSEKGYRVVFLSVLDDKKGYSLLPEIKTRCCMSNAKNKVVRAIVRSIRLCQYTRKERPDYCISFLGLENIFLSSIQSFFKVYSVRNDPSRELTSNLEQRIWKYNLAHADAVVFQTEDERRYFDDRIQKKGVIIGNPLSEGLPLWKENEHKKTIIAVGRLAGQKNFEMLIKAYIGFSKVVDGYRLEIYGEGELRENLQNLIDASGMEESIFLMGHVTDIHERMADAALYVSSSDYEGMSNSMLEALSIGVPTICTDCPAGGARECIVDGQNGFLVDVGNIEMLTKKMVALLTNESLMKTFSENSKKIKERLDRNKICEQWESVFLSPLK